MKRLIVCAVAALVLAVGCGSSTAVPDDGGLPGAVYYATVEAPDGRLVTCIGWDIYNGGGLSCDW